MKTLYTNVYEITLLQQRIMHLIDDWVHVEKTPIPQKKILEGMVDQGDKNCTVVNALNGLLKLGYIRRAMIISNKTYYVMLRRI